jgi:hypothetical protein
MAGRRSIPRDIQELKGAQHKNPQRFRDRSKDEPQLTLLKPPAKWMIKSPAIGFQEAADYRAIWKECLAIWPTLTLADREQLKSYCLLRRKEDKNLLKGGEYSNMLRIRSDLSRPRGLNPQFAPKKEEDPRGLFLTRKQG